ncbi:MAG: hypothetical protein HPY50_01400 [Firmicutes bacterium]|nr:hypothetical protein [Bacillota bacterium]
MTGVALLGKVNKPVEPALIYDTPDPGASVALPTDKLEAVADQAAAVSAVQSAASGMTTEQKQSATGIDLATLFAEEAVARAAQSEVRCL